MTLPALLGAPLTALLFVVPGLVLVRRSEWQRAEPFEIGAVACAGSIAWWAVGIWLVDLTRLPLTAFAALSLLSALAILAGWRRSQIAAAWRVWRTERWAAATLLLVAVVIISRVALGWTRLGFSVGDMTAHAYMAELIVLRDGLPATYDPLVAVGGFGSFPPGFHALAAIETLLTGTPTYRSTIHVLSFSLIALTLSVAALVRSLGVGRTLAPLSAVGALALARNPQFFAQWGGGPTLLAAALVMIVFRDALALRERQDAAFLARLAFLSAATVLVHQLPVASFLYAFPVAAVVVAGRHRRAWAALVRNGAIVAAGSALLVIPFALRAPLSIPPGVRAWAREWFQGETGRAVALQERLVGAAESGVATWPFFLVVYLGVLPTLLLFAGLALRWVRQRDAGSRVALALVAAHAVMFAGAMTEALPLWPSLYPTRIGIWLAPALAIALAGIGRWLADAVRPRALAAAAVAWLCAVAVEGWQLSSPRFGTAFYEAARERGGSPASIVLNEAALGAFWITTYALDNAVLTRSDVQAMRWVRANVDTSAVFATNFADGGPMLPAIAHRRVLSPHFNLDFYHADTLAALRRARPTHVYVGAAESPAYPTHLRSDSLDRDPALELVHVAGNARVYRYRAP
jgi:hypothetical protein